MIIIVLAYEFVILFHDCILELLVSQVLNLTDQSFVTIEKLESEEEQSRLIVLIPLPVIFDLCYSLTVVHLINNALDSVHFLFVFEAYSHHFNVTELGQNSKLIEAKFHWMKLVERFLCK